MVNPFLCPCCGYDMLAEVDEYIWLENCTTKTLCPACQEPITIEYSNVDGFIVYTGWNIVLVDAAIHARLSGQIAGG